VNYLGAVSVAINTGYRGALLQHVLENSGAKIAVVDPSLLERLLELDEGWQPAIVFTEDGCVDDYRERLAARGIRLLPISRLSGQSAKDLPVSGLEPWTTQSIIYTSGTTGPSKGVLSSYCHMTTMGLESIPPSVTSDRYLLSLPLFHAGATLVISAAIARGVPIAVIESFKTDTFIRTCSELKATVIILIGAMASFLLRRRDDPDDRNHSIRLALVMPLVVEQANLLRERYGFDITTNFNMSETSVPIRSGINPRLSTCGRVRDGVEARIVDENDNRLPVGEVGELIVRTDAPWVMSHGYHKVPQATAAAWRNGWFHTGDAFREDGDGNFYFIDRVKDSIRRRGENISSFELEREVLRHRSIEEVAAVGVRSEHGEDDVMVVVVLKTRESISAPDLVAFLKPKLAAFMLPRYVRFVPGLPKTPTSKTQKSVLRAAGVTADTWDRYASEAIAAR